jgi:IS5 family transposase
MSMSSQARYRQSDPRPTHDDIIHFSEVSWDDYERLLVMRGDHSAPRIAYLEGDVEIMSPSQTHESIKSVIGRLVETDCLERDIVFSTYGSWTLKDKARDPEMGHTCTGKPWPFGAKAHIGADADSALVHRFELTAANVADVTQTVERLHGEEARVHADAGYTGVPKREEAKDLEADWSIAEQRGKVLAMQAGPLKEPTVQAERLKATIRARVEHPFHSVKNLFRQRMLRYRGSRRPARRGACCSPWPTESSPRRQPCWPHAPEVRPTSGHTAKTGE